MIKKTNRKRKTATNRLKTKSMDRTAVLADLHAMLSAMSKKVMTGRIRDKQAFDLQLRAIKSFAYACSVFSNVLDASENEEILRRLDAIEGKSDARHRGDGGQNRSD